MAKATKPAKGRTKAPPAPAPAKKKKFGVTDAVICGVILAAIGGFGDRVPSSAEPKKKPDKAAASERRPAAQSARVKTALAYARKQLGKPYVWGAEGPNAFDCSGLVMAAWKAAGVSIPRTTFVQWDHGRKIKPGKERPGDLVFFNSGPGTSRDNPGHVGMVADPAKGLMYVARCTKCGPIKLASYRARTDMVGFRRVISS